MRIFGTVKDAEKGKPVKGAKVRLSIEERELAILYTDSKGKFETSVAGSYIDEVLICKVEKEGYKPQRITYDIEESEINLEIELFSVGLELNFCVKEEKENPLQGVKITLKLKEEQLGLGLTNKSGCFKTSLNTSLRGKKIDYHAELAGYEIAKGSLKLKKKTSCEIIMKKAVAREFNQLPSILGLIGGGLGSFVFSIIVNKIGSSMPIRIVFSSVLYGITIGLGLGLGLWLDMKKILRLVVVSIVVFFIGGLIFNFLLPNRIKGLISLIPFVVWFVIVGLSYGISIGLEDRRITLKLIIESLRNNKRLTSRLITAGLIAGIIAGLIGGVTKSLESVILFVYPIAGLSFGRALGLRGS